MKKRIVILVSGNGSNAQAIIDACEANKINGEVVAIISNKAEAYALERAKHHQIATETIIHSEYPDRASFDKALQTRIDCYQPDLIVLAGFMRILTADFVHQYLGRILNIHPSLLPKYQGLNTHQRAIDNGDEVHGCSVHFVTAELDGGPIVIQARVSIGENDNASSLASKVAKREWQIYPIAVEWFCNNNLTLEKCQVIHNHQVLPSSGILYDELSD
nr:phosphoribosylglycinamide formyltransferase [Ningiella ruwaisensis]